MMPLVSEAMPAAAERAAGASTPRFSDHPSNVGALRVLVADSYAPEGLQILEDQGANYVEYRPNITPAELLDAIPDVDVLLVRSRTQVTADVIAAGKRLKIVGRAGVGLDNIDVDAATPRGVLVMNAPGGNTISTAEHSVAMLLALARLIPQADASMKSGAWDKKSFNGVELRAKTLGVVGLGRIGREVAKRARSFGMRIVGYDPYLEPKLMQDGDVHPLELDELVRQSDFITLHVPLNDQTKNLIDARRLSETKPDLRLVNCARGGLIDETALIAALESGKIAGAALDVFEQEPLPADHPFRKLKNVVLTPHLAASTGEATRQVAIELAQQVVELIRMGVIRNAANAPSMAAGAVEQLKPYMDLAHRVGSFLAHLVDGPVRTLHVVAWGKTAEFDPLTPITTSLLVGFLRPLRTKRANLVNARLILAEQGTALFEGRQPAGLSAYANLLEVRAEMANGKTIGVKATVFDPGTPRIIEVNGKRVDTVPEGAMILLENRDVPGIVGAVCTVLGKHRINIAQMTWGRTEPGQDAMTIINCDQDVRPDVIEEIRGLTGVLHARAVKI